MDHYKTLGLLSPSNQTEIKKAYRILAKKYHPDINGSPEAEEKFKSINTSYEILGNTTKKKQYDNSNAFSFSGLHADATNLDINSMFSEYGFQQEKKPRHKKTFTQELKTTISLTFEESVSGSKDRQIDNTYKVECSDCSGYGGSMNECNVCHGVGMVTSTDGFLQMKVTCKSCSGKGKIIKEPCSKCSQKGFNLKHDKLTINIPAGITSKSTMVSRGNGNKINQKRGDLYISIEIKPSAEYRRERNNIIKTIEVSVIDIMQENTVIVKGFNGDYVVDMTNAFQGKNFVFPQEGIKSLNSDRVGDFIVEVNLMFPELTEKQKKLLSQF